MRTWSGADLSRFLDHVAADRLAGGWWLLATTGMRRGEDPRAALVRRRPRRRLASDHPDPDHDRGPPQRAGHGVGTPKTAKGRRSVALDLATITALRQHRTRRLEVRLEAGEAYDDGDLVVCLEDGTPVHPKTLSYTFEREIRRAGLPAIRLHDLRHTHATLALRAGVHPRVVQERLGHANVSITLDTYSHVDLDMQAAAAAKVAAFVTGSGQ